MNPEITSTERFIMKSKVPFTPVPDGEGAYSPTDLEKIPLSRSTSSCSDRAHCNCKKHKKSCITLCGLLIVLR